ncbi:MAG: hypothetical protein KC912_16915 [Proteobacteria bacterium]|nr:hypothetical protein [Pseudomonadota bacterium]
MRLAPLLVLLACGESEPLCPSDEAVLATVGSESLTCADAGAARSYIEVLAARDVPKGDRERLFEAVKLRFEADAAGTRADLDAARTAAAELSSGTGLAVAEKRSRAVYAAHKRKGPLMGVDDVVLSTMSRTTQKWSKDDTTELAMTELDVEGWLFYASLCREVQGGTPLKLSIADRVPAYQVVGDLFEGGTAEEQIALAAMGPFWADVKGRWAGASYEQQQAWISAAPLPPPMTGSSLGYFEAVMAQPPSKHAAALHDKLGPLSIKGAQ